MNVLVVLALCIASAFAGPAGILQAVPIRDLNAISQANGRIINGQPAVAGQFPWQAGIIASAPGSAWVCGGSIIGIRSILTAAHCVEGATSFTVFLGGLTITGTETGRVTYTTTTSLAHPDFNSFLNYDIGLITLNEDIVYTDRIQPVQLPARGANVAQGAFLAVSGWGKTSDASNAASAVLNWVGVTAISNDECARLYGSSYIIAATLCTVGSPNHGVCSGDSGGPLIRYVNGVAVQEGVVSFGASTAAGTACEAGFPSGFVRTSELLDWLADSTGLDL